MTGRAHIIETQPSVQLEPRSWHVFDEHGNYLGMLTKSGGPLGNIDTGLPVSFRAYGIEQILGLGDGPVDRERDFASSDEAVEWLLDGYLQEEHIGSATDEHRTPIPPGSTLHGDGS